MVLDSSGTVCPLRTITSGLKDCFSTLGLINGISAKAIGSGFIMGNTFGEIKAYASCRTL